MTSTSTASAITARPGRPSAWPSCRWGRWSRSRPGRTWEEDDGMAGAILMAIVLVVGFPVAVGMSGAVVAALLGWSLKEDADARNEGSELIELNRELVPKSE